MTTLKWIKTGLYRDKNTNQYYGIVKRGGKQIKRPLGTDREDIVEQRLKDFLDDNPQTLKVSQANLTWKDVREVWERQDLTKHKEGTQDDYLVRLHAIETHWPVLDSKGNTIRKPLPETRIRDIGEMDCKDWLAVRRKQLGKSRLRAEIFSLNWIFDKAIEMGCIVRSPSACLGSIKMPKKTPQIPSDPAPSDSNVPRLRLVMGLFRVRQKDICVATGYSKANLSQVLSENGFLASTRFWLRRNARLPDLVRDGTSSVFEIEPVVLDSEQTAESVG